MLGQKTGIALILAALSPLVAAIMGWVWGAIHGGPEAAESDDCSGCGYDLTGNVSGVCPECGLKIIVARHQTIEINHKPTPPLHSNPAVNRVVEEMSSVGDECVATTLPNSLDDGKQQIVAEKTPAVEACQLAWGTRSQSRT